MECSYYTKNLIFQEELFIIPSMVAPNPETIDPQEREEEYKKDSKREIDPEPVPETQRPDSEVVPPTES